MFSPRFWTAPGRLLAGALLFASASLTAPAQAADAPAAQPTTNMTYGQFMKMMKSDPAKCMNMHP